MDGYLLDTNILKFWFDARRPEHAQVRARIEAVGESPLYISAISLGEMSYGHSVESPTPTPPQVEFETFIAEYCPQSLSVTRHTAGYYGVLRASLFNKYAPGALRTRGQRPEQLIDPATSLVLGIQENDLWIAAQAVERNLVLVSHDKMLRIVEIGRLNDPPLRLEDWTA